MGQARRTAKEVSEGGDRTGMTDPHLAPLVQADRAETKYATIYLAHSVLDKEYSLHIKIKQTRGLREWDTLTEFLHLETSDGCTLNGTDSCVWVALGRKETSEGTAAIDGIFERYREHLDRVLETCWDYRCAMRDIGQPLPPFDV